MYICVDCNETFSYDDGIVAGDMFQCRDCSMNQIIDAELEEESAL